MLNLVRIVKKRNHKMDQRVIQWKKLNKNEKYNFILSKLFSFLYKPFINVYDVNNLNKT